MMCIVIPETWTAPIKIHREIQAVYGPDVMTVQHVRKWCREFSDGRSFVET